MEKIFSSTCCKKNLISRILCPLALFLYQFISSDPWSFWQVAIFFFLAGVKAMTTAHTYITEKYISAIRTAVRAHSGTR